MTSTPDSFARKTILERMPQIIAQVMADNEYPLEVVAAMNSLRDEIASQPIQPLRETVGDAEFWNAEQSTHAGKTWLELPWYYAEAYFYRKILEATGYFQSGNWQGRDPFEKQKHRQIESDLQKLSAEWEELSALETEIRFEALLHSCLWGNRADLSNSDIKEKGRGGLAAHEERHLILIDHTQEAKKLLSKGVQRVDFICDNVGSDLLFDLGLADFLLQENWAGKIHLNLKRQPLFVSDAMPADVLLTIDWLKKFPSTAMQAWGQRLAENLVDGRLVLDDDPFWTTHLMFSQMPPRLRQNLSHSEVVLIKGDANYRRLLEDRAWQSTVRTEEVCAYFPATFVSLRTLKSEIIIGLEIGQAEALDAEDAAWRLNGKRGIIQLICPKRR